MDGGDAGWAAFLDMITNMVALVGAMIAVHCHVGGGVSYETLCWML